MEIRKANTKDIERILEIYESARSFMVDHGNPGQWAASGYPPRALIEQDIVQEHCHVCLSAGCIVGVFYYNFGEQIDESYENTQEVSWIGGPRYGVVHRIASDRSVKGVGRFCLTWALEQANDLRIDTHADNTVMQNLLSSLGFELRGTVYVPEDHSPRLAYEKLRK